MRRRFCLSLVVAALLHVILSAQSPHGSSTAKPQPGPNVNAAAGFIANPADPAALVKTDILLQRQNETVVAASTRNPDHILAAANDYRFVDFPQDENILEQSFVTRLLAKLTLRPAASRPPARATIAVGAWTGVYRSCDRGATFIGSAVPGSPLDSSPASLASTLKLFSNYAASVGGHAETTDPTIVAGPNGQMHLFVLGFIRKLDGSVVDGRMYHVSYTDRNNREGGACFNYDYTVEMDRSAAYKTAAFPAPFLDKASATIDKDGTLYVSYTLFNDAINSRIVVARSTNGGLTWTKTSPLHSLGFLRNHGATMAVDPLNRTVYLAWRTFYQNWPMMLISKSYDRGRTFLPGTPINHLWPGKGPDEIVAHLKLGRLQPFDQFNNAPGLPATGRALAFPNIVAGVVNGRSKLFAVWTERADVNPLSPTFGQPLGSGSPRVMISASSDGGWSWTPRQTVDAGPRTESSLQPGLGPLVTRASGPQLQPAMNISGTTNPQLLVAYYEARRELDPPFATNFVSGIERQMDVRIARLNPVTLQLLAPSVQVSQYAVQANTPSATLVETAPGYPAVSRENLTMYGAGFKAFFGDYLTLASSSTLVSGVGEDASDGRHHSREEREDDGDGGQPAAGAQSPWTWSLDPASVLAIWTDHRDVKFPFNAALQKPDINGRWDLYTPVTSPLADCTNTGMRNANPYFAEIAGVIAGAPQTFKPLTIQRAFATYVTNQTPVDRYFRLHILDNEAAGLDGSFNQFSFTEADDVLDVKVYGNSRHSQTVWVQPLPSNPTAKLKISVNEITGPGGTVKPNGLRTSIVLNPDPNNDALTRVPATKPPFDTDLSDTTETHDPSVSIPRISNFRVYYPGVSSPQIDTPQIDTHPATPQIDTPQIDTPQIDTRGIAAPQIDTHLATPQIDTPQIDTPQIDTVAPDNGTDVVVSVTNGGTTTTGFKAGFNVPNVDALLNSRNYQFMILITRTSLGMSVQQTAAGCIPAALPQVHVLASISIPSTQVTQLAAIKNPQIDTVSPPDIATFVLAPFGGVAGQNSGENDSYSTVLPDEIKITLRAIRLKTMADILSAGGPVFDPQGVTIRVESTSTDVIRGQVQPQGTQSVVVSKPDLVVANYIAASPALTAAAGSPITLSSWTLKNQGNAAAVTFGEGSIGIGYYLSANPVITASDTLLASTSSGGLAAGGTAAFPARTVTLPAGLAPGSYYVGILVDRFNVVAESNENNNYVSEPITVTAPVSCIEPPASLVAWWPGDGNLKDIQGGYNASDDESGISFTAGKVGPAFTLNRNGDHARVYEPTNGALKPAQLTIDFWFRSTNTLDSSTLEVPLVVKLNYGEDVLYNSKGYDFFYEGTAVRFGLRRSDGFRIMAQRPGAIAAGGWHHVAGTFDGRYQRLYFDGALADTVDWQTLGYGLPTYDAQHTDLLFGIAWNSFFTPGVNKMYSLLGQLDEIQLFDRALTGAEVQDVYNANGQCRPIVLSSSAFLNVYGQPLTLTAQLVPTPPAGSTVEFLDGATVLAARPVSADGSATLTTSTLSFAAHSLSVRSADTPARAHPSAVLMQHLVKRFDSLAAFNDAIAGEATATQDFNAYPLGTSFKYSYFPNPPTDVLIPGVLFISSSFSYSSTDRLEVYDAGYLGAERVLFGYSTDPAYNPRTYAYGGYANYYAYFASPSTYNAMAFDIVGQDPTSTPAKVNVYANIGTAVLPVLNPSPTANANTFIGMMSTLPMDGVYIAEGCTSSTGVCVNSPIKLDNFIIARRITY